MSKNMYTHLILVFFGVQCINNLMFNFTQIHSSRLSFNKFLEEQRFSQSFQKLISCSAITLVGLVESRESSKREPSAIRVMNIPKKQQTAMPLSFGMEVRPIRPFRLLRLPRSLAFTQMVYT